MKSFHSFQKRLLIPLFVYLILKFEKTNQTRYLKTNNLSTIIDQAIWSSRKRQPHPPTNIKPQPEVEGPFVLSTYVQKGPPNRQTRHPISNSMIYQLLLLIKQSREVELTTLSSYQYKTSAWRRESFPKRTTQLSFFV